MGNPNTADPQHNLPFVAHLVELRTRLLWTVGVMFGLILVLLPFANPLYETLARPMMAVLPVGTKMIATEIASPFLTPFKFTALFAFFIAVPYVLYQAWAFIAPGLYSTEKRIVIPLLVSSSVLFYVGVSFCYFVVLPLALGFLTHSAPGNVEVLPDISHYLDFAMKMSLAFGFAFEVPVATVLIIRMGISSISSLAAKRKYVILGAFILGAIFTPPDVLSQFLLAIPLWILFEIGLITARYVVPKELQEQTTEDEPSIGSSLNRDE